MALDKAIVNEATRNQLAVIRERLETVGWIDRPTALRLCDCDRLSARIWDLRYDLHDPMDIETVTKTKKNRNGNTVRYAVYRLKKKGESKKQ